jgi:hypothetical protein
VKCVMKDGMCSTSGRLAVYVCGNTFHLKASQQSTSSLEGKTPAVKVANVITVT